MKVLVYVMIVLLIVACGGQADEDDILTPPTSTPTGRAPLSITPVTVVPSLPTVAPANTPPPAPSPTMAAPTPMMGSTPSPTVEPEPAAIPTVDPTPMPAPSPTPMPTIPPAPLSQTVVSVGNAQFLVEVAATAEQREQGLSGRPSLATGTGMLFVFDQPEVQSFTMAGMQFNVDFVWISTDCTVVGLTEGVSPPQPGQGSSDLPSYQSGGPVKYALTINAETVFDTNIEIGNPVSFEPDLGEGNSC